MLSGNNAVLKNPVNNGGSMTNDDALTFIRLAAVTANVVRFLHSDKDQDGPGSHQGDRGDARQRDNGNNGGKVDQHLNAR